MKSRSVVRDRVGISRMGHPTAPYPSLDSGLSHSIGLGDPLAPGFPMEIDDEITPQEIS